MNETVPNQDEARHGDLANYSDAPAHPIVRLLSGLIDMVLLFFIHFGLYSLVIATPIANAMNDHWTAMQVRQDELKLQTGYGEIYYLELGTYQSDYSKHHLYTEEGTGKYYIVKNVALASETEQANLRNTWAKAVQDDAVYLDHSMAYHLHNYVITALFVGGVLETIWFLVIPLIAGCGQTPGMMICGLRMIHVGYYGRPKWYHYLGRTLFIFVIESCFPYFFLANWTLVLVPVIQAILVCATPRKRALHDLVSGVMVVNKAPASKIAAE